MPGHNHFWPPPPPLTPPAPANAYPSSFVPYPAPKSGKIALAPTPHRCEVPPPHNAAPPKESISDSQDSPPRHFAIPHRRYPANLPGYILAHFFPSPGKEHSVKEFLPALTPLDMPYCLPSTGGAPPARVPDFFSILAILPELSAVVFRPPVSVLLDLFSAVSALPPG